MELYNELLKIENDKEHLSLLTDDVLDLYSKYPEECKRLLIELGKILDEFENIEKEIKDFEKSL